VGSTSGRDRSRHAPVALGSQQITRAATVWVWPSAAPCDTTLQACLDNASSGDEVLIAQSGLINEQDKIIDKSLTLEPEPGHGYTPQIEQMIVRTDTSATSPVGVLVSHVQVATTLFVQLESASASGSTMTLDHSPPRARAPTPGSTGSSPMVPRSTSSSRR
jgi:hypothetical protein